MRLRFTRWIKARVCRTLRVTASFVGTYLPPERPTDSYLFGYFACPSRARYVEVGLQYGPAFRLLSQVWIPEDVASQQTEGVEA